MIEPSDLPGVDSTLALRIIGQARATAPCIMTMPDGNDRTTVIAILQGVATVAAQRGSLLIKAQRVGPAAVDYRDVSSYFSEDDRNTLRALCATPSTSRDPIGSFPQPGITSRMWPENC